MQAQRHAAIGTVLDEFRIVTSELVPVLSPVDITDCKKEYNNRQGVYLLSDEAEDGSLVWRYVGVATVNLYNRLYVAGIGPNSNGEWVKKFAYKWTDFIPFDLSFLALSLEALLVVRLQPTENKEFKSWRIPTLSHLIKKV